MADTYLPLDDIWGDLKTVAVLGVHGDPVYQLVTIGKLLLLELLFQIPDHFLRSLRQLFDRLQLGVKLPLCPAGQELQTEATNLADAIRHPTKTL